MPKIYYSWRLKCEVPLLSDAEYEPIAQLLSNRISSIKNYREMMSASLPDATEHDRIGRDALNLYEKITGMTLDDPLDLYSVKLSEYGRPCPQCAKPFRTPRAKLCVECGFELPVGEVAGAATF